MKEAKDLVVIVSPFLNRKRAHKFISLPKVKGALKRDVPMIVVTGLVKEGQVSDVEMHRACINMLRENSVKVVIMEGPKLHFKSVVIDNAIIYLGSINPLSILTEWKIPADYMMRFESKALVDEVIENVIEIYEKYG